MSASNKKYIVETSPQLAERCMLMCTDPGDLVFDPTCGSGTTAFVAETWGRRWITCDTSRVALNLAKQRFTTSSYPAYKLQDIELGIRSGYLYKKVETPTTEHLAYKEEAPRTIIFDQPLLDSSKVRVSGPFTVEAVPAPVVTPIVPVGSSEENSDTPPITVHSDSIDIDPSSVHHQRIRDYCDELAASNIRTQDGRYIQIKRIELLQDTSAIHALGEALFNDAEKSVSVAFAFGPTFAPLDKPAVESAFLESQDLIPRPEVLAFVAFQIDPASANQIETATYPGVRLLKVQMNTDLLTADLKSKSRASDSFWLVGQPDVEIHYDTESQQFTVEVLGFDYLDVASGELDSGNRDRIVMWMLDPDYNGRCFVPSVVYFPNTSNDNHNWRKLEKTLRASVDREKFSSMESFQSSPIQKGEFNKIAVKIVDDRGIESLRTLPLKRFLEKEP